MKPYPAIALLEFRDISAGLHATDTVVKKAPIAVLKSGTISDGRYLTLIGGTTASVQEAYREGLYTGQDSVLDHLFLPDIHPDVHEAILGRRSSPTGEGAIAVVETNTVTANVWAAERALKTTPVALVELRLTDSWLAGKGVSIFHGELADIEAAVEVAVAAVEQRGAQLMYRLITSPHDALAQQVGQSTHFVAAPLLDLDGESLPADDGDAWAPVSAPRAVRKARSKKKPARKAAKAKAKQSKKTTVKKKPAKKKTGKKSRKKRKR